MGKNSIFKKRIPHFLIYPVLGLWLLSGCTTPSKNEINAEEPKIPVVENVNIITTSSGTVLEIINSRPTPYTAFKLNDPPRVILDISGIPGETLPFKKDIKANNIDTVSFIQGQPETMMTRMIVTLTGQIDYTTDSDENLIRLNVLPKKQITADLTPQEHKDLKIQQTGMTETSSETVVSPSEPRIFLTPKTENYNNILGIDFTMLEHGKSRLIITSNKKADYNLDRDGERSLALKLSNAVIHELILKDIDASQFESALTSIKPSFAKDKKEVNLIIELREMVPFHVKQTDNTLNIDFGQTIIKPVALKITPLAITEAKTKNMLTPKASTTSSSYSAIPGTTARQIGQPKKRYAGDPMYLDFVNADVTNILRLINEISDENIIWDPVIQGKKVSMILKNVPWDEALDLILQNNDLAMRNVSDNIIWITTKAKMKQIQAEEDAEIQKEQKRLEDEKRAIIEAAERAKELEPLITEYIPVDFASADEIKTHITLTDRGVMSIDTRTNTLIIKDIASSIEDAMKTVRQFDTPVKQIMIEARIVDASTAFSRSFGIRWNSIEYQNINSDGVFGIPADPLNFGNGGRSQGGMFSTNTPVGWASNLDLTYGKLASDGLSLIGLDASLALAESDGMVKVISAPKVIAREGTSANISSGDSLVIAATENVASTTLDATLSLTVSPTSVSYNDLITLDVSVTDDSAPSEDRLKKKSIDTTLMIKSGETVVIGGILKDTDQDGTDGVPGLKDIPGLGWLFKAKTKRTVRSELMIFLTPTVLPSPGTTH